MLLMAPGWVRTDMGGPEARLGIDESIPNLVATIDAQAGKGGLQYLDYLGRTVSLVSEAMLSARPPSVALHQLADVARIGNAAGAGAILDGIEERLRHTPVDLRGLTANSKDAGLNCAKSRSDKS